MPKEPIAPTVKGISFSEGLPALRHAGTTPTVLVCAGSVDDRLHNFMQKSIFLLRCSAISVENQVAKYGDFRYNKHCILKLERL